MDKPWTVLIADDEPIVRKGLRKILDDCKEFRVVSAVANGKEAVESAAALHPSVIILDVRMPRMDGLDALGQIRQIVPASLVIMLSAYSEFSYAQRALQLGAHDYILKPAAPASLLRVLEKAKARLLEQQKQAELVEAERKKLTVTISGYAEHFYLQLLEGRLAVEEANERLQFLNASPGEILVILVSLDDAFTLQSSLPDFPFLVQKLRKGLEEFLREEAVQGPPILDLGAGLFALICKAGKIAEGEETAARMKRRVREACAHSVTVAFGSRVPLVQAAASYKVARSGLDAQLFLGDGAGAAAGSRQGGAISIPSDVRNRMQRAMRYGDFSGYRRCLRELMKSLGTKSLPRLSWQLLALELSQQGLDMEKELGLSQENDRTRLEIGREVRRLTTISDIRLWLERTMQALIERIAQNSSGRSIAVRKALAYMAEHYAENIDLSTVASVVSLTSNYLSQLFRQETGKTFLQHLCGFRVNAAKELLATGKVNVSEAAYRVGYADPRSFSKVFHRLEGVTPGAFRSGKVSRTGSA